MLFRSHSQLLGCLLISLRHLPITLETSVITLLLLSQIRHTQSIRSITLEHEAPLHHLPKPVLCLPLTNRERCIPHICICHTRLNALLNRTCANVFH